MPDQFFIEEYRQKADLPNPIAQSGRGRQFEPTTFLYVVREVIQQLDLRPEDELLDVGCANGMLDIVLVPVVAASWPSNPSPNWWR
jgi:2-polyprenyl-3-methyl-5-hydroxy-6-metoxy-1,4-benzoquinol methylase